MADDTTTPPLSALNGAVSLEDIKKAVFAQAASQNAARQSQMDLIDQQAQKYGQTGISDLDKASMLFQAAGALSAPTRSGGLMESIGAAGTAVSGPLAKAAQAQRDREEKLAQLQLARAKLAGEMSGGPSPSDLLQLYKAQVEAQGKPSEFDRILAQLPPDERAKALRVKAGLEEAAGKKKDISDTLLTSMEEKGGALTNLEDLSTRFKPDYAGKIANTVGEAQNVAGSRGIGWKDQAVWWSDYAERRNVLRNTLFGSAVTATEKAEFEKADIAPGMDPEVIKEKLARQREIAKRAAYKLAKAKEAQGYDIAPLEAALGYKISDLEPKAETKKPEAKGGAPSAEERLKILEQERRKRDAQGQ
jgi:hypothetical protein